MTDFFLISTCLVLSQYTDANSSRAMANRVYQDRGYEKNVSTYLDKTVDEAIRMKAGSLIFATKTLIDQRVIWSYSF